MEKTPADQVEDFEDGSEEFDEDEYDEDEEFTDDDGSEEDAELVEASQEVVAAALKSITKQEAPAAPQTEIPIAALSASASAPAAQDVAPEAKATPSVKPSKPELPALPAKPVPKPAPKPEVTDPNAWKGISVFPQATIASIQSSIGKLQKESQGKKDLTIMLLGKNGVGKSSTANSLFGEKVFNVSAFQSNAAVKPAMVSKSAAGFTLSVIDTPGLLDGDSVNEASLDMISEFLQDKTVDVVVYVDRLDGYRVTKIDQKIMEAITNLFGPALWSIGMFVLTHGQVAPPEGHTYSHFVEQRSSQLQAAARACEATETVPVVVVENGSRCATNKAGEKILPDETLWVSNLVTRLVDVAVQTSTPALEHDPFIQEADVYAKKKRWMIIPLFLLNAFIVRPLLTRQIKLDPDFN
ncbi:hypothetical protein CYMTET_34632 [Cymbomonas tetramitiformis]|uniref:AIG1-type G domain-containing protein n=1 Tax=Cymbomonas tetramitiformis TaxID=36881 RepID=A0AAE0KQ02_9CHLO|nr:hypothetical protein CYMTET_34632 [Cymbomonas tetramitiformis]|eukprot:gene13324-15743_t